MSEIDRLVQTKCPNGVEYKTLGELEDLGIITLGRGKVISKKDIQDNPGEYPIYSSSAVGSGIFGTYGDYMFDDVRLSWSIDGGGKFFYRDAPRYSVTNVCGWLTVDKPEVLNIRYLYFALTNEWSKKVFDYVHKAHPSVIRKEYTIPVPPLEVQQEIVRMLNSFTELEAELEAELTKRKLQYKYYSDSLLNFNKDEVKFIPLGEYGTFYGGLTGKTKDDFTGGNAKFITYMNAFTNIATDLNRADNVKIDENEKQHKLQFGDIIFTGSSETPDECGMSSVITTQIDEPVYLNSFCFSVRPNNNELLLPEFSKFLFRSNTIRQQIKKTASGVTRFNVSKERMKKIIIPIPPIEEQHRIANILDKFNSITTDISSGLPAEIKARRQQYEYYRDKLLTFKEKVV